MQRRKKKRVEVADASDRMQFELSIDHKGRMALQAMQMKQKRNGRRESRHLRADHSNGSD